MEPKQTAQMVAWLDEERRKDKAMITKMEERTAAQATLIEDQARRLQSLEGEMAAMRASYPTLQHFDETTGRLRTEITQAVEQLDNRRANIEQDMKKQRDLDREGLNKALEETRNEVFARIDRELQPRRAEEERLSRVALELQSYADNLSKGFEEFERNLTFLEEQRRQDSRRISDANSTLNDINKRLEGQQAKLELLEELSRRNERGIEEHMKAMVDFQQQRKEWIEDQSRIAQERERTMMDMIKRMDDFNKEMDGFGTQFDHFTETHRTMKKYVDDFDRLADRMDRRLNEVAEIQRLSEDRFRQEWEDFMQEDQKRWRQFTLNNEESWRTNEKSLTDMRALLVELNEHRETVNNRMKVLITAQQEFLLQSSNAMQTAREQLEDGLKSS